MISYHFILDCNLFVKQYNTIAENSRLENTSKLNETECIDACIADPKCTSVSHNKNNEECKRKIFGTYGYFQLPLSNSVYYTKIVNPSIILFHLKKMKKFRTKPCYLKKNPLKKTGQQTIDKNNQF